MPNSRSLESTEMTEETSGEIIEKEYQIKIEEISEKISTKANITLASSKVTTTINQSTTSSPLTTWPTSTKSTHPWSNHALHSRANRNTSSTTRIPATPVQIPTTSTTQPAPNTTKSKYRATRSQKAKIKTTRSITIITESTTPIPNAIAANTTYYWMNVNNMTARNVESTTYANTVSLIIWTKMTNRTRSNTTATVRRIKPRETKCKIVKFNVCIAGAEKP